MKGEEVAGKGPDRVRSLTGRALGQRLLRTLVAVAIYLVLEIVMKAVAVTQFIVVAIRGEPSPSLQVAGAALSRYLCDVWSYGTFASNAEPWPFGAWPNVSDVGAADGYIRPPESEAAR